MLRCFVTDKLMFLGSALIFLFLRGKKTNPENVRVFLLAFLSAHWFDVVPIVRQQHTNCD